MRTATGPGCVVAGRYELLDQIGQGAMGTVWRARDLVLDRDVAVKQVRLPELMSERDRAILRERTLREARVSAKLSHPAVVTVHDVIEADGTPWIVMELVAARSLAQVLAEDGPLPPRQVAETGMMLLGALASAHAAGIVHRDVKPGNVLLTSDGRAVLTDFGIATVDGDPELTQTGVVVGTPGFCAPERIRGGPASPASDLWSLGATLYAAAEGHGPFDGNGSPMAVLASIVHSDPPPSRSAGPLGAVIGALLSKDPARRPDAASAGQLLAAAATAPTAPAALAAASTGPAGTGPGGPGPDSGQAGQPPARPGRVPDGDDGARASARTDPIGFPASPPPAPPAPSAPALPPSPPSLPAPSAASAASTRPAPATPTAGGSGTARFPAGANPGLFSPAPGSDPFSPVLGPDTFPPTTGSNSPGAGPAPFPGLAGPPVPSGAGSPPLPTSMGAAPLPSGSAADASLAGPGAQPGTRPAAGRRLLAAGLAGVVIVVAGLVAGLVWSRAAGPSAPAGAGSGSGGAPSAAAALPAGYHWYTGSATAGAAHSFAMAVPAGWQARQQGSVTYLWNPPSGAIISVSPAPGAGSGRGWEARVLERAALGRGSFASYRRLAVAPFLLPGQLAGAWRFAYRQPGMGAVDGLVVVTQVNAPGGQQYELTATAPVRYWLATRTAFAEAVRTFSPRG